MFKFKNTKLLLPLIGLFITGAVSLGGFGLPSASAAPLQLAQTLPLNNSDTRNVNTTSTGGTIEERAGIQRADEIPETCDDGLTPGDCKIVYWLMVFINTLSAVVGIVIVTMITIGGVQYSTTRDNPQAVQAARQKIYNAIIALIVYIFGFSFLQWLVPGGIF